MWRLPLLIRNRNHMLYCYTKESPCKTFLNQALSSCSCISMSRWCSSSSSSEMRQFDDFENGPDDVQPSQNLQSHPISTATDNLSSHKKYTKSWSVLPIWSPISMFQTEIQTRVSTVCPNLLAAGFQLLFEFTEPFNLRAHQHSVMPGHIWNIISHGGCIPGRL